MADLPLTPGRRRKKADYVHLRALVSDEPCTPTGRVLWIWQEIQAGLAQGKTAKEVWQAAQRDGLDIPYPQFRVYVSRLRRRERIQNFRPASSGPQPTTAEPAPTNPADPHRTIDPLHN